MTAAAAERYPSRLQGSDDGGTHDVGPGAQLGGGAVQLWVDQQQHNTQVRSQTQHAPLRIIPPSLMLIIQHSAVPNPVVLSC